jgi:hypothetical protein
MLAELKVALAVIGTVAFTVVLIWAVIVCVAPLVQLLSLLVLPVGSVLSEIACDRVAHIAMPPGRTLGDVARFFLFIVTVAATFFLLGLVLANTVGS